METTKELIETHTSESTSNRPLKVLVVEDDLTAEPIWQHIIEKADAGATMTWATSFDEASDILRAAKRAGRPYDLVVSDIFLSGSLTGIDLWHSLNAEPIGFVLVSSIAPLELHRFFRGIRKPLYLQKPLNFHETIETIYEVLHQI